MLMTFLLGAVLREAIFICTGNPNRPKGANYNVITLAYFAGVYLLLTLYAKRKNRKSIG